MSDIYSDQHSASEPDDGESVDSRGEENDPALNEYEDDGFLVEDENEESDHEIKKIKKKKDKK